MPDRIDSIVEKMAELESKVNKALSIEEDTGSFAEPSLSMVDIDKRIEVLVPQLVRSELGKQDYITKMAAQDMIDRTIMSFSGSSSASVSSESSPTKPTKKAPRKPATARKKAVKPRL